MRRPCAAVVLAAMIASSCSTDPTVRPVATSPPPETTMAPTTSTQAATDLVLTLDETEAVALEHGTRLEISDGAGKLLGWLDQDNPSISISSGNGPLTIRYLRSDGRPSDVEWVQVPRQNEMKIRQTWRGAGSCRVTLPDGSREVRLVWQSGGDSREYLRELDGSGGMVSVVSPIWWRIGADGQLTGAADPQYVSAVHDRNVAIWPAVAGYEAGTIHSVLSDQERRTKLASRISEEARSVGADGVNIDLEGYRVADADEFVEWVEELGTMVRSWGGVLSHDLVPHSDDWEVSPPNLSFWSTAPLRSELSQATDCTVLMAYDEHNRHRPAGPVASPAWVEDVLIHALRHADPSQLVLGIPFYGRVWNPSDLENPEAVSIGEMDQLAEYGTLSQDSMFGLDRVDLADGRYAWIEGVSGLEHRLDLVERFGLAGWAAWRFGFDDPAIWQMLGRRSG